MLKINPTPEAIKFHYDEVSKIFDKLIINKYITRDKKQKKIEKCFISFLDKYKEELINAEPKRLLIINSEFEKKKFSGHQLKLIKSFFIETGYKSFPNKKFLNHLNIDTCTYCNKNYTLQYDLETNHARAELDHWFPIADFPILALSFYNLIPSCHSCNHLKHNNKPTEGWEKALENMVHPYLDKIDFSFSYHFEKYNEPKAIVKPKDIKSEKTISFNKTKEIYEAQSDKELKDLLNLRYKYSDNYIDILLNKTFKGVMSKEKAYRMIFGIEIKEEDYHKRPFSKFKKDIIEELMRK